jgi:hypothetical protein
MASTFPLRTAADPVQHKPQRAAPMPRATWRIDGPPIGRAAPTSRIGFPEQIARIALRRVAPDRHHGRALWSDQRTEDQQGRFPTPRHSLMNLFLGQRETIAERAHKGGIGFERDHLDR